MRLPLRAALVLLLAAGGVAPSRGLARAEPSAPPASPVPDASARLAAVLPRLAQHAARFEEMKRRGSFTLRGKLEELDGGGRATGTKEVELRSIATPAARRTEIVSYLEDGADKTSEARAKAEKRAAEAQRSKNAKKRDLHLPFLASEQARYRFSVKEAQGSRLRVDFEPIEPAEDAYRGAAWVDEGAGEVLTMGFAPSRTEMFVDQVDVTVRFDLATPLGRAPSSIGFAAQGGLLFFRKRVRATGTISSPALGF